MIGGMIDVRWRYDVDKISNTVNRCIYIYVYISAHCADFYAKRSSPSSMKGCI